jgi:essential nuclear protein 1
MVRTHFQQHFFFTMPKVKKIRAAALDAQQTRHAPLGQVIQDDENRGKYAVVGRNRSKWRNDDEVTDELLDEKTSKRILEISREQQQEIEIEEERERKSRSSQKACVVDSDDDEKEEDDDEPSVLLGEDDSE